MINEPQREIVHRDAMNRAYFIESDGRDKRLVQDDSRRPTSLLGSLIRAVLGRN